MEQSIPYNIKDSQTVTTTIPYYPETTIPCQGDQQSLKTGDPNPDVCEDCGGPLTLSDHIREQIHLRRQFIFEELDKLDRQERNLDNENISSILDLLEDYTDL